MAGFSARHDKWCWDAMAVAVYHHEWRANAPELHIVESKDTAFAVLVMACAWGKPLAVEAALRVWGCTLLNKRDELKRQPLHVACLFGQLGIVRRLARYKELRVNDLEDEAGARRTALMIAAAEGHLEIVTFLVEHMKAKVGLKDAMGRTALDHAREGGKEDVVEYLSRPATSSKVM
jgi:ankyrin repeat protein